jgi:hypothetical protein
MADVMGKIYGDMKNALKDKSRVTKGGKLNLKMQKANAQTVKKNQELKKNFY